MEKRWMIAEAFLLTGCAVVQPTMQGRTLVVNPQVLAGGYGTRTSVPSYTQASIDHLILKLFTFDGSEHDQGIQKIISNAQLGNTVTFTNLKANTTYRIKALAYASTDESSLISTADSNSYIDVALTTDDRPIIANLKVKLIDRLFDGQATSSGVVVNSGGYTAASSESCVIPYFVTTIGGNGSAAFADGTGTSALFKNSAGVAADALGNVYVADTGNHRIRKIAPSGVVTTIAGNGTPAYADGTGTSATFSSPNDIAIDAQGNLFVSDSSNHRVRKISPAGVVTTVAGSGGGTYADGTGTAAAFNNPFGMAVDTQGNLYVADHGNQRIRKISPAGVVTTVAGNGATAFADGMGTAATFNSPWGVAVDAQGNLYVADQFNHRIRKINTSGQVTTFVGNGVAAFAEGTGTAALLASPLRVAVDSLGYLYIIDEWNSRVRKVDPNGVTMTIAGNGSTTFADGIGSVATFYSARGIAVDAHGIVYVADCLNNRVRKVY